MARTLPHLSARAIFLRFAATQHIWPSAIGARVHIPARSRQREVRVFIAEPARTYDRRTSLEASFFTQGRIET
ncbi:MAG: hypothetical protein ACKOPO_05130, partial [Novosphingobium sp.]